jgi:hypothetical protein
VSDIIIRASSTTNFQDCQLRAAARCPAPGDPVAGPGGRRGTIVTLTLALDRPARARVLCADGITRCVALTLEEDLS